mgnify:FL=1
MNNDYHNVVVGKKQVLRELKCGKIAEMRIAVDCDADYTKLLIAEARKHNVKYLLSGTMREIADEYGIDVPCGVVGTVM